MAFAEDAWVKQYKRLCLTGIVRSIGFASFPVRLSEAKVGFELQPTPNERNRQHSIQVRLRDPDGKMIKGNEYQLKIGENSDMLSPVLAMVAIFTDVVNPVAGFYRWEISHGGKILGESSFEAYQEEASANAPE